MNSYLFVQALLGRAGECAQFEAIRAFPRPFDTLAAHAAPKSVATYRGPAGARYCERPPRRCHWSIVWGLTRLESGSVAAKQIEGDVFASLLVAASDRSTTGEGSTPNGLRNQGADLSADNPPIRMTPTKQVSFVSPT